MAIYRTSYSNLELATLLFPFISTWKVLFWANTKKMKIALICGSESFDNQILISNKKIKFQSSRNKNILHLNKIICNSIINNFSYIYIETNLRKKSWLSYLKFEWSSPILIQSKLNTSSRSYQINSLFDESFKLIASWLHKADFENKSRKNPFYDIIWQKRQMSLIHRGTKPTNNVVPQDTRKKKKEHGLINN